MNDVKCTYCGADEVEVTQYTSYHLLHDFIEVRRVKELNLGDHGERQTIFHLLFCSTDCAGKYLIELGIVNKAIEDVDNDS